MIFTRMRTPAGEEIRVLTPMTDKDVEELERLHREGTIQDGAGLAHLRPPQAGA